MIEFEQKFIEFMCPLHKEFSMFVTHANHPEKVVCGKCPYTMWKKDGVTREEIKKKERNVKNKVSMKSFYDHLLSIQNK